MRVLREGMEGEDVRELQNQLLKKGFPPGLIDGVFGPGTEAAVIGFQRSEDLLADGVVGPRTAERLALIKEGSPPAGDMPDITVAIVAKMFPVTPIGNIKLHLPPVLTQLAQQQLTWTLIVLAALATIRAETEGFVPIDEGLSRFNTSPNGHPFDLYDNRQDLGNRGEPDGALFKGRGFIQLTGRHNYTRFGQELGHDLVNNPGLANDPIIAAQLLVAFLKSKERLIKQALLADDLRAARRLVNGGSHRLDRFTDAYRIGQQLVPVA